MKVFISHASEDKEGFVENLAELLRTWNFEVWYDAYKLRINDYLEKEIKAGIDTCDYAIIVLSSHFFKKKWTLLELNLILEREKFLKASNKISRTFVIPIWLDVERTEIASFHEEISKRLGIRSSIGAAQLAQSIWGIIEKDEQNLRVHRENIAPFNYIHRYYNPAKAILRIGHPLTNGTFESLMDQLRKNEIIILYYVVHNGPSRIEVACHITGQERMAKLESSISAVPRYYAVDAFKILEGFDKPISDEELIKLSRRK